MTIVVVFAFVLAPAAISHDHLKAEYVPWGIDEYELFGLTKDKLAKDFKNKIRFNKEFSDGYLTRPDYGPHFLFTYNNNQVSSVQRMFIDGYGCHIMGPILNSKKEALKFSIDGLTALPNGGDKEDHRRLLAAKKLLANNMLSGKTK
jgi:hypothetical protein